MKQNLHELNQRTQQEFVSVFGSIFEHSPWIAARAWEKRPFDSVQELHAAMCRVVRDAPLADRLALIQAHPDLAGRLARLGQLTPESTREQASVGIDAMSHAELACMEKANAAYRTKFGFPFIICARLNTKDTILSAINQRLTHDPAIEMNAALEEIYKIARLRLEDLL